MKKLFIAGAALLLMAGMSVTALAAGQSRFLSKAMAPQAVWRHHAEHSQKYMGRTPCTVGENGYCDITGWQHHSGTGHGSNCQIADGNCTNWTDADGNGVCDDCGNPVYRENADTAAAWSGGHHSGNCQIADGHCTNWTDADGNGVCDDCGNPVYQESRPDNNTSSGSGCGGSGHRGSGHHGRGHHR